MGNLDRRSFLKGGVVAAGAAAFAGALSACAPSAPQETGAADETLATTGEAWYGSPADPATFDVVDTVDCEVLVCGLGAGGITAAAAAAEKGMNVIAIEKGAGHGSIKSDIGVIGTRIDTVEVDPLQMLNEHTRYANGWCDPRVTRVWATESGATFDWISDSIAEFGATPYFEYDVDEGTHGVWPVYPTDHGFHYTYTEEEQAKADAAVAESGDPAAAQGILPQVGDYMLKKAEEWGADLRYETPFVQLAQDENGKVTGAYAKIGDGYVLFNASKGVILATGGYEANPDLLAELNPDAAAIGGVSMTQAGCEGEGIKAGIWAGGMKDEIPTLMTFARAAVAPDAELGYPYQGMTCWIGDQPFLKVNLDGAGLLRDGSLRLPAARGRAAARVQARQHLGQRLSEPDRRLPHHRLLAHQYVRYGGCGRRAYGRGAVVPGLRYDDRRGHGGRHRAAGRYHRGAGGEAAR